MTYDLIVLGGGPAGYLASERAAHAGLSVCCIEERSVGGVCLNEGCIPTKTLLYSAKIFDGAAHGEKYGVSAEGLSIDHAKVVARKDKVVKTLVSGVQAALKSSGVTLVSARGVITGRTADGYTVVAGGETYVGERLLIATGSSPSAPPIPGLKENLESGFVCTNREILQLTQKPEHLCVIGGGVIGLELASYFASIGTKVTIIEMLDHIAGENDPDLVAILKKSFEKRGATFLLSAKVTEVKQGLVLFEQDGKTGEIPCDKVLLSIGRRANTQGIGLESIYVLIERGAVVTDTHMKTNQPEVYAAGDVNGKSMLAHTAYREAEVAVNTMLGKRTRCAMMRFPACCTRTRSSPPSARRKLPQKPGGLNVKVVKLPMRFSGRYLAENEGGDGMMKLVADASSGRILGAQVLANYASEFIVSVGTFIELGMTVDEVKKIVFPHPTVGEIVREAVFQF